jgi:hypothetical protein
MLVPNRKIVSAGYNASNKSRGKVVAYNILYSLIEVVKDKEAYKKVS